MSFRITVHLLEQLYQASTLDRSGAEWPPHPARVFCSLVSVADPQDPVHEAALQWLERQPAPRVRVAARTAEAALPRSAWVPTNATAESPGHAVLPGRTNGRAPKVWPQRALAQPEMQFQWAAAPPPGVLAVLETLAKAVPYFGRATGHAFVHAAVTDDALDGNDPEWEVWEPAEPSSKAGGQCQLRTPYPGYLERLRWAHAQQEASWQQARSAPYIRAGQAGETGDVAAQPVPGLYADLLTFAFPARFSLPAELTVQVAAALRSAVMSRLDDAGHDVKSMPAVHGHKQPARKGKPEKESEGRTGSGGATVACAYLALPFVGRDHADGRLRGVGVALPHGLDPAHRRALLAVLLRAGGGLRQLSLPAQETSVSLTYVGDAHTQVDALLAVRPERWSRPSREWATALPMVLDHFPKRHGRLIEESVATSCQMAGLPLPEGVGVLRTGSYLSGGADLPAWALRRKEGEPPLPSRHVRVRFREPVTGPVVLGSKKNFGLGLCLPLDSGEDTV
ncbi:type I-U CRISPR-associated protein Csb2 [Streptomyces sp. NPDC050161]|uniref:type I-G CRISPR-associated protein Csb2 n=1 Tax=Streptomyces sp. NPDC050161 TaxID=3365604 RepID=UPI0037BBE803